MTKHLTLLLIFWSAVLGCNQSDTYEDKTTNTIYLIEDWESLDNHSNYANWRAETGLANVLEPLLEGGAASLKMIRCGEKLDI